MAIMKREEGFLPAISDWFREPFFRDFFGGNVQPFSSSRSTLPSANLKETSDDYQIDLAAPGMSKEDFKISLDGEMLSISSEKSEESSDGGDDGNYSRKEFSYQRFYRSFQLPQAADADQVKAKYQDGILHLSIPKKEEAKKKRPRTIQIS